MLCRFAHHSSGIKTVGRIFQEARCFHNTLPLLVDSTSSQPLKKTALYDFHVKHGGVMVPFAGWTMPVSYSDQSILTSHIHTRENASLFDVSHMLQLEIGGRDRIKFVERLLVSDVEDLLSNQATLSVFTNDFGGCIDDLIITKRDECLYLVANAGCAQKDIDHLNTQIAMFKKENAKADINMHIHDRSLLALQGPKAEGALAMISSSAEKIVTLPFMFQTDIFINNVQCTITRCGYTGEDGFEISLPSQSAAMVAERLLSVPFVKLAGLGARDTLRLEAGLCLYGHELNESITPVEAGLTWCIGKKKKKNGLFLGASHILPQIGRPLKKRIGLIIEKGGAPARAHDIIQMDGKNVGEITSGTYSPSLECHVAMGYIDAPIFDNIGGLVDVVVRGKLHKARISKLPFVPNRYKKTAV